MSKSPARLKCFYCGQMVIASRIEQDHFPKPAASGGTHTVNACVICHDLKDRTSWDDLPPEMMAEFMEELAGASRSTRIVLAMFMRMAFESVKVAEDATKGRRGMRPAKAKDVTD